MQKSTEDECFVQSASPWQHHDLFLYYEVVAALGFMAVGGNDLPVHRVAPLAQWRCKRNGQGGPVGRIQGERAGLDRLAIRPDHRHLRKPDFNRLRELELERDWR